MTTVGWFLICFGLSLAVSFPTMLALRKWGAPEGDE